MLILMPATVNFLYSGYCKDLELESSSARVSRQRKFISVTEMSVIQFFLGFSSADRIIECPLQRGVRKARIDCITYKSAIFLSNKSIVSTNSDTFPPSKFAVKPKWKNHLNEFEYREHRNIGKGMENITIKMNSLTFRLFNVYSNSLKMANVSEFP